MPKAPVHISSTLTLESGGAVLAGHRWMELLRSVEQTRSIAAAAKAVGLSYKAAWDAVESMNNLADGALVERVKGGKGGGGTRLTARGRELVETWGAVEEENRRFMQLVNTRVKRAAQDLRIIGRMSMLSSARNNFAGKVVAIHKGAVNDEIELKLPGGDRIVAVITCQSTENLGLKIGSEAIAMIKASWVIVGVDSGPAMKLSARNRLKGKVTRITPGAVNTEVVIGLKGGNSVAAIITNTAAEELKLAEGKPASAIFKASSVILGVAA